MWNKCMVGLEGAGTEITGSRPLFSLWNGSYILIVDIQ